MIITFSFDEQSLEWKDDDFESNWLFAKEKRQYLLDLYQSQGYLYLNTVYETFGLAWNPYGENPCLILGRLKDIEILCVGSSKGDVPKIDIYIGRACELGLSR